MTDRELMQQALETLLSCSGAPHWSEIQPTVTALRERLAQPERKPVAWLPSDPPPECTSEAEKTAFAFGWFKALEEQRVAQPQRTHWEGCDEVHPECRKQEPVAWMYVNMDGECEQIEYLENEPLPDDPSITPLYTGPQPAPTIAGYVPAGDTSPERVDEAQKQRQEQKPVAWIYRGSKVKEKT